MKDLSYLVCLYIFFIPPDFTFNEFHERSVISGLLVHVQKMEILIKSFKLLENAGFRWQILHTA
ncbi:hypothetical protein T03_681 [Trichinella britovi]|uniref:Uncharacterized protein n=1 Tax=Trichinella britovi TaxID=45882 RepID=A0A0V0ZIY3_TRIBR|nr:hypothetical protein T03_681 [Trichinella britovi]